MTWRKHFGPRYNPWDQRMCLVPKGDLFRAIRKGHADVVTDTIDRFTATGIRLNSGRELPADIIITATGLNLQLFGGATVDRRRPAGGPDQDDGLQGHDAFRACLTWPTPSATPT